MSNKKDEEIFLLKEKTSKFEEENKILRIENKKNEEIILQNKSQIKELTNHKNSSNEFYQENKEDTFNRLENLEKKLKEIFNEENKENRKIISEKNEKIEELQMSINNLEENLCRFKLQFEELSNKSYDLSVSEIRKRDEVIAYISEEYEKKLNSYNEEQKIISSLFHKISYEYASVAFVEKNN